MTADSATKTVSFAIPVYRNEKAVSLTYQKIKEQFENDLQDYNYEFVFVDDGSDDGSLNELMALRAADPCVKIISFTRNFGQMPAMLAGFKNVTGDCMITVSADLQDPAELIPQMVKAWAAGAEIVICHRTNREDGIGPTIISKLAYALLRLAVPKIPPGGFDFALIGRTALDEFNSIDVRNRFFQGDILWLGYSTHFIPYTRQKREIGRSQYNFGKRLKNLMDAFLDSSYLPIRLMSSVGMITALLGLLWAATVVYTWAVHKVPFSGWAPIMVVVLVLGGTHMMMLGIIGEYIWRIFDEVRKKPNYIIRNKFM